MLRRLNDALPGLIAGIVIYGVLVELIGVWFVPNKLACSIGLWYGIVIAIGMSLNMASVIYDSVFQPKEEGQVNYRVVFKSILRYVIVVLLFVLIGVLRFGNIFAAFVGLIGLKVSVYMQPTFQKFEIRMGWREPDTEELAVVDLGPQTDGKEIEVQSTEDEDSKEVKL